MVGLVEIAAVTEKVTLAGAEVEVPGVSAAGIASLLSRFPALRKMMSGVEVAAEDMLAAGPDALAAILAAGTGAPGDAEAEAAAAKLSLGDQADLLAAILRVTLPGGVGPFVEKLEGLGLLLDDKPRAPGARAGLSGKGRASRSRKRSKR